MVRRVLPSLLLWPLLAGCVDETWLRDRWALVKGEPDQLAAVSANPFVHTTAVQARNHTAFSQAALETAARVDTLGRQILAANQQLGVKPLFVTIGGPQPEIFHLGTSEVYLTEGLVKKCASDSQLAAVLCTELGKMVAAREALAGPQQRAPDRPPPEELRVGNDHGGGGAADLVYRAELARFEKDYRPSRVPPNPRALAETCLYRAGHDPRELDAVAPLLQEAAENRTFAKQLSGVPPTRPWTQ